MVLLAIVFLNGQYMFVKCIVLRPKKVGKGAKSLLGLQLSLKQPQNKVGSRVIFTCQNTNTFHMYVMLQRKQAPRRLTPESHRGGSDDGLRPPGQHAAAHAHTQQGQEPPRQRC